MAKLVSNIKAFLHFKDYIKLGDINLQEKQKRIRRNIFFFFMVRKTSKACVKGITTKTTNVLQPKAKSWVNEINF